MKCLEFVLVFLRANRACRKHLPKIQTRRIWKANTAYLVSKHGVFGQQNRRICINACGELLSWSITLRNLCQQGR